MEMGITMKNNDVYIPESKIISGTKEALTNEYFRQEIWTGYYSQMTLMSIPINGEVGEEVHEENDQILRIEFGNGIAILYNNSGEPDMYQVSVGDTVFVPAGTRHNIVNMGNDSLKLSSVYSPAHHPVGTKE